MARLSRICKLFALLLAPAVVAGCATTRPATAPVAAKVQAEPSLPPQPTTHVVAQTNFQEITAIASTGPVERIAAPAPSSSLAQLEQTAIDRNPRLARLYREYQAATARSQYVDKLPDPKLGANIFGDPIETAAGSQRANMNLSQAIPWLGKLNAEQQRAYFEAFAVRAEWQAEQLRVVAALRTGWYQLYVIEKQIETAEANKKLLTSLIDVANARIATGKASRGDVLLGTLELSQLEERLLLYRRQRRTVEAEINRLVAQPADTPIQAPATIVAGLPIPASEQIYQWALDGQPEIEAARLRMQATVWGIEVARLSRRPELMLSAGYFFTDDNRPPSTIVDVGKDPWAIGAQISIPIWRKKYDAMHNEARWKHLATHGTVDEIEDRYDAMILDLWAEARRAAETATLYDATILPQARQTLAADQQAYSNGVVEFDRVVRDYSNLLTLELGYYKAVGDLATAAARLSQAAGRDIPVETVAVPTRE